MDDFMPVDAYRLLRQCVNKVKNRADRNNIDEATAADYLVNRGFVERDSDGKLTPTDAGRAFGRVSRPVR